MQVVGVLNPIHVLILFMLVGAEARASQRNPSSERFRGGLSAEDETKNQHSQELYQMLATTQHEKDHSQAPSLSTDEIDMIRKRILDGLGLRSIPKRSLANITREEFNDAYSEYLRAVEEEEMKSLYEEEEEEDEEVEEDNINSSFRFYSNKVSGQIGGRGRRSVKEWQKIVHFQVYIPSTADINSSSVIKATSKFWKKGSRLDNITVSQIPVSFYRLDDIPRGRFKEQNLSPILLETRNISVYGNEWVELDMKNTVNEWLKHSERDTGVLIRCPSCEEAGVRFMTGSAKKDSSSMKSVRVPRLDVQTEIIGLRRVKRSRKTRKSMRKRARQADCADENTRKGKKPNRCCRRSMQVRFSDFEEFDFIISPTEFDAFYCSGRCPARYIPANEHALLQAFVKIRERNIPGPCCAPTELKGMPILHIGNDGQLTTSYWSDVIVTKCECT